MKKILFYSLLAFVAFGLSACNSDPEYSDTHVEYYPVMTMLGESVVENPIGQPYTDAGCTAMLGDKDYTSNIITTGLDEIDVNKPGVYTITYSCANEAHSVLNASVSRTVAVCDPSITTNIEGTWTGVEGTYRDRAGTKTAYPGYSIKIRKDAPGIFYVSDLLDGYYDQRAGYGSNYACKGYIRLFEDNHIELLSSSVAGWGDSADSLTDGKYDPATGTISYVLSYAGMDFYVVISK